MASLDHTQGGHSTYRRTKHTAKSLVSSRNDWLRSGEPHSHLSPHRGRHGGIESSEVRPFSSHLRQPPSVTPTSPTSSRTGSTSTTTTRTPDRPTISRPASMRAPVTSGRGPRPGTLLHHIRPVCVLEEDSDEDDNGNDDDEEEEEVVVPAGYGRSRSKSLHRESRRETRSRSAHPFRSRSESRYPESRRDVSPRSNPFRSRSQSRRGDSRRDGSPRSGHPYRSTPVSRRSPRTSMSDSEHDTDASSVADEKAIQPRNKALDAVPIHMSMHERMNRGQESNSDQMLEDTTIYHVPSVGDEQPPSHRSSQKRDPYRRPRVTTRDDYDDDFHRVYHRSSVDDGRSRSRPQRPSMKYYPSEEFTSKPAASLKRTQTVAGSLHPSSQSMGSSTRRSNTFHGGYYEASGPPPPPGNHQRYVSCVICMDEEIPVQETAMLKCRHRMCYSCLKRNFKLSIKDPQSMPPRCCTDDIPLKHVESLFDDAFKQTWNKKFAEYSTRNRIYCPSTRCNEWIKPEDIRRGEDGRKYGKCGRCKAKVCCTCRGRWHASSRCPKDDETNQFLEQAQREGWKRCHRCKAMVELKEGCNHMTCRCGAEFCMICGSKWKSCKCPLFDDKDDTITHMQTPTQVNSRAYPRTVPRFSSGLPPSPPSPRGFRSEPRPSATDAIRPRPPSYEEEELVRHLREQREAHVSHHKMQSFNGFDGRDGEESYEREIAHGPGRRSRARTDRYVEEPERPDEISYRRRAATVVAPSPPPSRHQTAPLPHPPFERANSGPGYDSAPTWAHGQLHQSPDRVRSPTPDRHRPPSPSRYRYTSPKRHPHPSPDRHHHAPDPDRLRPRSPDKRRTSSFERRLIDRFNQGSRHIAHSAPIGPPMGIMPPPMMAGPMSPIRPGQPPPPHIHPASHPMHHHHPGPPHTYPHPPIPMAPIPPPGSGPMPPRMNMRGMEADEFFNSNKSTRSLEPVAMPRREKEPAGSGGGGGMAHAPTVRRRPTGQAHRDHIKAEPMPSVQAGLTGPGRGMERVYEWRNYVEPGLPEGEQQSVVSGPGS